MCSKMSCKSFSLKISGIFDLQGVIWETLSTVIGEEHLGNTTSVIIWKTGEVNKMRNNYDTS